MLEEVLVAHPGTQYSFQLARELFRLGLLGQFHTTLAFNGGSAFSPFVSKVFSVVGQEKLWQNRVINGVPFEKVRSYPTLEVIALLRGSRGQSHFRVLRARNDRFQESIPDISLKRHNTFIGFDTSSRILASRANSLGKTFVLDRSIAYEGGTNGLFELLQEKWPEWTSTQNSKSPDDLMIEDAEHELARLIVVPSRFVEETLVASGVSRSKIRVNPFGTDIKRFTPASNSNDNTLKFLFVGALQARKGVPLLLEAWRRLKPRNAHLLIAGHGDLPTTLRNGSSDTIKWLGAISREKLPALFRSADVFVFPSYFEGLAQVQLEAAACGLPVIGTTASGASEFVKNALTGYIIEPGDVDQLVEKMDNFIASPKLARDMSEETKKDRDNLSWTLYGDRWNEILKSLN